MGCGALDELCELNSKDSALIQDFGWLIPGFGIQDTGVMEEELCTSKKTEQVWFSVLSSLHLH